MAVEENGARTIYRGQRSAGVSVSSNRGGCDIERRGSTGETADAFEEFVERRHVWLFGEPLTIGIGHGYSQSTRGMPA